MDDDAEAAKRSPRKRQQPIDVAIIYNVDFEEARLDADPSFESRATVEAVAEEVAAAIQRWASYRDAPANGGDFAELRNRLEARPTACSTCASRSGAMHDSNRRADHARAWAFLHGFAEALGGPLQDRVKQRLVRRAATPHGTLLESADALRSVLSGHLKPARGRTVRRASGASVVYDEPTLRERVTELINLFKAPVLAEEYVEGREFNVALLGYPQARVLPLQEIDFSNLPAEQPRIVSYDAKWNTGSVEDLGTQPVMHPDVPSAIAARMRRAATEACRAVGVRDYGRVDIRLSGSGIPYVIDVNPNCDLSPDAGYARAAQSVGIDYPALLRLLVRYALRRRKGVGSAREARAASSGEGR
jgi:D-alanine-D-alanine ligase